MDPLYGRGTGWDFHPFELARNAEEEPPTIQDGRQVFSPKPLFYVLALGLLLLGGGFFVAMVVVATGALGHGDASTAVTVLVAGLLMVVLCLWLALAMVRMRVVISPQTITYRGLAQSVTVTWDKVVRAETQLLPAKSPLKSGLVLAETVACTFIPLSDFEPRWERGQLGMLVRAYAPHASVSMKRPPLSPRA